MSEWEQVGVIGVNSGMCWIGDPAGLIRYGDSSLPKEIGTNWKEFCANYDGYGPHQFKEDNGSDGLGVCMTSGFGDGTYPVMARICEETGRVAEVKVVFLKEES